MRIYESADATTFDVIDMHGDDIVELLRVYRTATTHPKTPATEALLVRMSEFEQRYVRRQRVEHDIAPLESELSTQATANAIADALHRTISQRYVRKLCDTGKLRYRKLDSGHLMIEYASVMDYIATRLEDEYR